MTYDLACCLVCLLGLSLGLLARLSLPGPAPRCTLTFARTLGPVGD